LAHCFAFPLHKRNEAEGEETDAGLGTEGCFRADFVGPSDLEVGDDEARGTPAEVEPGTDFSGSFWVTTEDICLDSDGGDKNTENEQEPPDGSNNPVIPLLEREAKKDQPGKQTWFAEVQHAKTRFGLEDTLVVPNIVISDKVVEEVSNE